MIQVLVPTAVHLAPSLFPPLRRYKRNSVNFEELALIWQLGFVHLQREMDCQFGLLALLRSMTVTVPPLLSSIYFWCVRTNRTLDWAPVVFGLFVWFCCGVALRRHVTQYGAIRTAATMNLRSGGLSPTDNDSD